MSRGQVIAVVGASGGLGVSTLAACLARRGAELLGTAVAVDLDDVGAGIDHTMCLEHHVGCRWVDLAPEAVPQLGDLPVEHGCHALSASASVVELGRERILALVDGLADRCPVVILDLPRRAVRQRELSQVCDIVVLVAGVTPRRLADSVKAAAAVATWNCAVTGVLRSHRRVGADLEAAVAEHLGIRLIGTIVDDQRVVRADRHGRPPGTTPTAPADVADHLLGLVAHPWAA